MATTELKKQHCGSSTCHGHGDYAVCGKPYYGSINYQCPSCALKEANETIKALKLSSNGQQTPIAYLNDAHLGRGHVEGEVGEDGDAPGMIPVYQEPLGCLYIHDTQALELLQQLSVWDRRYPVNCHDGYAGLRELNEIIADARKLLTDRGMNDQ